MTREEMFKVVLKNLKLVKINHKNNIKHDISSWYPRWMSLQNFCKIGKYKLPRKD